MIENYFQRFNPAESDVHLWLRNFRMKYVGCSNVYNTDIDGDK